MRPNYAQDPPPTSIEVGGHAYPCETDYRVWLDVLRMMRQIRKGESQENTQRNYEIVIDIQNRVFGGVLKDEWAYIGTVPMYLSLCKCILTAATGLIKLKASPERYERKGGARYAKGSAGKMTTGLRISARSRESF